MAVLNTASLQNFAEYFRAFESEYALIGGAACHLWFASRGLNFRNTVDVDMVLLMQSRGAAFLHAFSDFIEAKGYDAEVCTLTDGTCKTRLYRFLNHTSTDYPAQIELLGPDDESLSHSVRQRCIPVKAEEEYSGLSCMILEEAYHRLLRDSRRMVAGIPLADEAVLVLFKIRAYLNIMERRASGAPHGSDGSLQNAHKHRNDILLLLLLGDVSLLPVAPNIRETVMAFAGLLKADATMRRSLYQSLRRTQPLLSDLGYDDLDAQADRLLSLFPEA